MSFTDPPLTTVRQPIELMGRSAVALLISQIGGAPASSEELLFEPELVVRGSTGPAVAAEALRAAGTAS
jgi:DNA-binding LacI/PurR family transcriptional regulator